MDADRPDEPDPRQPGREVPHERSTGFGSYLLPVPTSWPLGGALVAARRSLCLHSLTPCTAGDVRGGRFAFHASR